MEKILKLGGNTGANCRIFSHNTFFKIGIQYLGIYRVFLVKIHRK
jgi:hypothetical protein